MEWRSQNYNKYDENFGKLAVCNCFFFKNKSPIFKKKQKSIYTSLQIKLFSRKKSNVVSTTTHNYFELEFLTSFSS